MPGRVLAAVLLLVPGAMAALGTPVPSIRPLGQREKLFRAVTRDSEFASVPHVSAPRACENIQPPQPLTTPDPLFSPAGRHSKVKVSFIVGTDGRVHSPLILESAGTAGDRDVLQIVRTWRYRPATCNGVPTETEGKIQFSSR